MEENKLQVANNKGFDSIIHTIEEQIDRIAQEKVEVTTDKDGKEKTITKYQVLGKTFSTKADLISTMALGYEMGLNPISSIIMGSSINTTAALQSVLMGRSMNINPIQAINNIYPIDTGSGKVAFKTGVHIIEGKLAEAGVKIEIIKDGIPQYIYRSHNGKSISQHDFNKMDEDTKDNFQILDEKRFKWTTIVALYKSTKDKKLDAAIDKLRVNNILTDDLNFTSESGVIEGKTYLLIPSMPEDKLTTVRMTRPSTKSVIEISFSLQNAIDAKLMKGISTDGEEVKGKSNWINYPEQMLRNYCISVAGNMIAGDKLNGIYSDAQAAAFEPDVEIIN